MFETSAHPKKSFITSSSGKIFFLILSRCGAGSRHRDFHSRSRFFASGPISSHDLRSKISVRGEIFLVPEKKSELIKPNQMYQRIFFSTAFLETWFRFIASQTKKIKASGGRKRKNFNCGKRNYYFLMVNDAVFLSKKKMLH